MTKYEVHLKLARGIISVEADKFSIDGDGFTVFYSRPGPGEKFQEVRRFSTSSIAKIEETK